MGPKLVDYLLYEPEDTGILWIKFNRPERLNALIGSAEMNGTVAKVGEYMRAGDDDPNVKVIVLTGVGRGFCSGADMRGDTPDEVKGPKFSGDFGPEGPDATPGALLSRLHQAAPRHLAHPQAHDRDDKRPRRRLRHGHGAPLRHSARLRDHSFHRLPPAGPDNRERRLILPAQDGRAGPRPGVRVHRPSGRQARLRVGPAELPGAVGGSGEDHARAVRPHHARSAAGALDKASA